MARVLLAIAFIGTTLADVPSGNNTINGTANVNSTAQPVTTISFDKLGQPPLPPPPASLNWSDPCAIVPLEPATWTRMKLDDYLANYPDGKNLTLTDYALTRSVQNFVCGVGENCNTGQPCNPIPGPEWEVLYAVQNWNLVQNTLYNTIGVAVSMTQSITSAMVADLYHPTKRSPLWKWNDIFSIAGGIAALIASVVMIWPGTLLAVGIWYSINAVIATGEGAVGMELLKQRKQDRPDPFQRWSEFSWYLGKWQSLAQGAISNQTTDIINAGISTPQGISGVLKNGTYMRHIQARQFSQVKTEVTFTATARILTAIIRDYGGFVTIGEGCHGKGPNGAWEDPNSISYCYPNKTMMNVIRHKKDKAINSWYHGSVINSSYGFTAEYLTTQSYNCQLKYGKPNHNPYNDTAVPTDRNADCVVNLPVCDTRIHAVHEAIKKHGTVKACRDVAHLPI